MNDRDWYLRNNSRQAIADMFRVIRRLQVTNDFKTSYIVETMLNVWRAQHGIFLANYLALILHSIKKLEEDRDE